MKYMILVGLIASFLISILYCIKADSIRDWTLNMTKHSLGSESEIFKSSRLFVESRYYVLSFRVASGIVAVCILILIYFVIKHQ